MIALFAALLRTMSTEHYRALQHALCTETPESVAELQALACTAKDNWNGRFVQHLPVWRGSELALVFDIDYDCPYDGIGSLEVKITSDHIEVSEGDNFETLYTPNDLKKFLTHF
jgi:hypothetical protein